MAFKDKCGITNLPTEHERQRLSLSHDHDDANYDIKDSGTFACLLWVPNIDQFDHWHIKLSDKACLKMHKWLGKYLKAKGLLKE